MKKVVKRKVYDTDTAKQICKFLLPVETARPEDWKHNADDIYLYQKKTGEYFIYRDNCDKKSRKDIFPITEVDANAIKRHYNIPGGELFLFFIIIKYYYANEQIK